MISAAAGFFSFAVAQNLHAEDTLAPGYSLSAYYTGNSQINGFDWGSNGQLFFNNGFDSGDVYRVENGAETLIATEGDYGGASVLAIGDSIYFNASDQSQNQFVYRYDIATQTTYSVFEGPSYSLHLGSNSLFISGANGAGPNTIFYTGLDTEGNFVENPPISIGAIAGASGALSFDSSGNLFYSPGYIYDPEEGGRVLYRWSADEVALAMSDPLQFSLEATNDHIWFDLEAEFGDTPFAGASSMAFDEEGNLLLTLTNFSGISRLVKLGVDELTGLFDGDALELLSSNARLGELRFYEGNIYIAKENAIYQVVPEPSTFFFVLAGLGALMLAQTRRRKRALAQVVAFAALFVSSAGLHAGDYSQAGGDQNNAHDPGIPGFVGPQGDGIVHADNDVNSIFVAWATDVVLYSPAPGVKGYADPAKALGPITGSNTDVVSLGDLYSSSNAPSDKVAGVDYGILGIHDPGFITLGFDLAITNGVGADFAVFENGFISGSSTGEGSYAGLFFAELAYVEVSTNGVDFARFPSISETPQPSGRYDYLTLDPTGVYNLAGKHANSYNGSWGTPFNLDDLLEDPFVTDGLVDLGEINFVRLVDVPGSGDFLDSVGNPIYDGWVTWGSGGFDLEGLGVINQIPEPSSLVLGLTGAVAGLALWRRRCESSAS